MMPELSLPNLLSWTAQVSVLALIGAALPAVFRIRHPRSNLVYCYGLLIVCITLPLLQPWHQPAVSSPDGAHAQITMQEDAGKANAIGGATYVYPVVGWLLLAGVIARLLWFFAGLWQIHRYRVQAKPLQCLPESVRRAQTITGRSATVCISPGGPGPVTFGLFRPVILLPESFDTLEPDAQCAVMCHELLHVKRRDWLVTVIEELFGACMWFHPAVWWLLSQTRLGREQVVDAEVIRLTAAPDPYIDALLTFADVDDLSAAMPAPLFLHKRHLMQRLRFLLIDRPVSTVRLCWSYAAMAVIVALTCGLMFTRFPLWASAPNRAAIETRTDTARGIALSTSTRRSRTSLERAFRVGGGVTAPKLVSKVDPEYPDLARESRTQGSVIIQGVVETDGTLNVTRVLRSLSPELDRNAIDAMKHWRFEPGKLNGEPVPIEIDVEVNFNLQPRAP